MAISITFNGAHRLDQTSAAQLGGALDKDDYALDTNLDQLPDTFEGFLEGLSPALTAGQLANAADYELGHEADAPNPTTPTAPFLINLTADGGEIVSNLSFTRSNGQLFNGQVATDGGANITTAGSVAPIYLYSFGGGDILIGSTEAPAGVDITNAATLDGSQVAFAYYLQENAAHTGADVWGVAFQPLNHLTAGDGSAGSHDETIDFGDFLYASGQATLSFNFDTLKSGKFLWVAVGNNSNGLLATGKDLNVVDQGSQPPNKVANEGERESGSPDPSDAMNTSQGGQGATIGVNNQMFTPGSTAVLTLVKNFVPLDADGPDATGDNVRQIDYGSYINTSGAGIFISQLQGGGLINMTIRAYEAGGGGTADQPVANLTPEESYAYIGAEGGDNGTSGAFEDDHPVPIAMVEVRNGANAVVGTWVDGQASDGTTQGGVKVTITGNAIDIDSLPGGYTVNLTAAGTETFNRMQVQADAGSTSFDIGRVDVTQGVLVSQLLGDKVFIHDDGPAAAAAETALKVIHDETAGVQTGAEADDTNLPAHTDNDQAGAAPAAFTALGTVLGWAQSSGAVVNSTGSSFGTDGAAASGSEVWVLKTSGANADSGFDTIDGKNILLNKEGDLVVGRVDGDGNGAVTGADPVAIAVSLSQTGVLGVAQYAPVAHLANTTADQQKVMTDSVLVAELTIKDKDGDTAVASVAIGDKVIIEDDKPTAGMTETAAKVVHDETAGVQDGTESGDPTAPDHDQAGAAPAAFTALGTVLGWATNASAVVDTSTTAFGTDGAAATGSKVLSLNVSAANVDSGFDTIDGKNILLNKEGDLVVGRVDGDGNGAVTGADPVAIAVSLSQTGQLSVAQYVAVAHLPNSTGDQPAAMNDAALVAELTVKDGDNDTATTTVAIGDKVVIEDDKPTAGMTETAAKVVHDETAGVQDGTESGDPTAPDHDQAGAAPAAFTALGAVLGWATNASAVVDTSTTAFGRDGAAASNSKVLGLNVSAANADSGFDTIDGKNILLNKEGDLVVGRVDGDGNGAVTGADPVAIAVSISQTGQLSFAQYLAVAHLPNTTGDQPAAMNDGALVAELAVKDGDNDTATTSVAIGDKVVIEDDKPTAGITETAAKVIHDETAGVQNGSETEDTNAPAHTDNDQAGAAPAAFTALGAVLGWATNATAVVDTSTTAFGTDGAAATGSKVLALNVSAANVDSGLDTLTGFNIRLNKEGDLVVGRVDGDGNGVVTVADPVAIAMSLSQTGQLSVAQYVPIAHLPNTTADQQTAINDAALVAELTAKDGDNDTAVATVAIGDKVVIEDDKPTAGMTETAAKVVHDETAGVQDGTETGDSTAPDNDQAGAAPAAFTALGTVLGWASNATAVVDTSTSAFGTDGAAASGSKVLALNVSAANVDSGFDTLTGFNIRLNKEGDLVVGRVDGDGNGVVTGADPVAIAVSIGQTGVLSFAQYLALAHTPNTGPDQAATMNDAALVAELTVKDGDNDTATTTVAIGDKVVIEDSAPAFTKTIAGGTVAWNDDATGTLTETHGAAGGTDGGSGGAGGVKIVSYTNLAGFTETLSSNDTIVTYKEDSNGLDLYRLTVTSTNYTFSVLRDAPPAFVDLNFAAIPSGSPQETLTVPAVTGTASVTFDGVNFNGAAAIGQANLFGNVVNPGAASTVDDLNPDSVGFGEKGGQASQMNENEGFVAYLPVGEIQGLRFHIQGIGGINEVDVEWWMVDDGVVVDYAYEDDIALPSGQGTYEETIVGSQSADFLYVRFFYDTKPDTSGVRVEDFSLFTPNVIPDRTLQFQLQITDTDLDTALSNSFSIHVDPTIV